MTNARLSSVVIAIAGPGPLTLNSPTPLAIGTLAPGASADINLTFNWPATNPSTRARMTFNLEGDFAYSRAVIFNNLFR